MLDGYYGMMGSFGVSSGLAWLTGLLVVVAKFYLTL
nr:hypothetical protein [uncultured archaeon]